MGNQLSLFRVNPAFLDIPISERIQAINAEAALALGHLQDIIKLLSASDGFVPPVQGRCGLDYFYPHREGKGRFVTYLMKGDPVISVSIKRAYLEDFWPLVNNLAHLQPFVVFDPPTGNLLSSEEFAYSSTRWMEKQYCEKLPEYWQQALSSF